MRDPLAGLPEQARERAVAAEQPSWINPMLATLTDRLASLERARPPFSVVRLPTAGVHRVRPELVAQIGFSEWTGDRQLRHPRFLGLRHDKRPREVVRERPQ